MDSGFLFVECQTFSDEEEANEMDTLPNDFNGEFDKVDSTWMLSEGDEWTALQHSTKNISEIIAKLEDDVESSYKVLQQKISGIKKEDVDKTEQLLEKFKTRWITKCKETENLRISLKRAAHESTRVNDDYNDMQESVSKMRKQFGQAIDSSVTEIEELSICNNSLSQRIHELETKIMRGDRAFKSKAKDNLSSLRTIIDYSTQNDITIKSLQTKLKKEADKIDRMIVVESLFDVDQTTSNLAEKSQKMVDAISQGLVETLKLELQECRNIVENQRRRIKDLEREKEEFMENQLVKNDGVEEMNELLVYLRKSVLQRNPNEEGGVETTHLKVIQRHFRAVNKLIKNIKDGLDKSFKNVTNKSNEISEFKDNIKDMEEQVKGYALASEDLQEEKRFLKSKLDHVECQHRLTIDELNTIQKRLTQVDSERKTMFDENMELKGGKENMRDFCSNLSGENNELIDKLKAMQNERDKQFADLQEQMQRTSASVTENNELGNKCEKLENIVTKIRREYQDQTRESNILSRENEDLKRSLQDSEQDRMKLRRNTKAVETGNKDLEDQIFQLTNDLQKYKSDHTKLMKKHEDSMNTIQELHKSVDSRESEKCCIKKEMKDAIKQHKEILDTNRSLTLQITSNKEIQEKTTTLLTAYEKLLIKLLHQRKELMTVMDVCETCVLNNPNLQVTSSQSIDYKNISEIKSSMATTTEEVDMTYDALNVTVADVKKDIKRYEEFLSELFKYTKTLKNKSEETNDSCYSTESETMDLHVPGRDVSDGRRGLSALKSKTEVVKTKNTQFSTDSLSSIMNKLKKSFNNEIPTTTTTTTSVQVNKYHKALKRIRQLETKLKNRKTLEHNLRNKLSHIKKDIKVLKEFHRSFHNKSSKHDSPQRSPERIVSPSHLRNIKFKDILDDLKLTENELKTVRKTLENCEDETLKDKLGISFTNVDQTIYNMNEKLSRYVPTCNCEKQVDSNGDNQMEETFEVIKEQRQYMLEHLTFTNKRLEVLLNCLKGRETDVNNNFQPKEPYVGLNTRPLLRRVRQSFDNDRNAMKKAVSILELTKAISITNLTEIDVERAIDDNHRDLIVLVKDMNGNMESLLREARSKITDAKVLKREDTVENLNMLEEDKTKMNNLNHISNQITDDEFVPKSELLKKESELKVSLENAQKKVEDLSQFLQKREKELKERDAIIAKLNQEYQYLQTKATDKTDANIATRDRIIEEYASVIKKLEKENNFLQIVVKELRDELLNFQSSYKKEEETQQHLQEFINELQICKNSLEKSLDKVAYELNIVKQDRDHLMMTVNQMNHHGYQQWYSEDHHMEHMNVNGYPYNGSCYDNCNMCSYQEYSESTTFPFSEDDWTSFIDDREESTPSDGEQDDVVSSSESQKTTSSRVAKTISTLEATESIKSKNRPKKYLKQETRTRKPMLSPKISSRSDRSQPDPFEGISFGDTANNRNRVQGRRELSMRKSPQRSPGRRSSIESNTTVLSQRVNTSVPNSSRNSSRQSSSGIYETISYQQAPVQDIESAVQMAANSHNSYYEDRKIASPRSPRDELVTPFLNQNFEKKKKKKFLPFGKK